MTKLLIGVCMVVCISSPAHALRITNLDTITHRVALEGRGEVMLIEIEPDATEHVTGATQGLLSLLTAECTQPSRSIVHADGVLSGIIGNECSKGIPVGADYTYVIWPGGHLRVQSRIKYNRAR